MPDTVPYQAYKSKRHTPSNSSSFFIPNVSPLRPSHQNIASGKEKDSLTSYSFPTPASQGLDSKQPRSGLPTPPDSIDSHDQSISYAPSSEGPTDSFPNGELLTSESTRPLSPPVASTSRSPQSSQHDESQPATVRTKRTSTFRHVPPRNAHTSTTGSHLGSQHHTPAHSRHVSTSESINKNGASLQETVVSRQPMDLQDSPNQPTVGQVVSPISLEVASSGTRHQLATGSVDLVQPPPLTQHTLGLSMTNSVHRATTPTPPSTSVTQRPLAPYHPGFQPGPVCHILTDDFILLRQAKQEGEGSRGGHGMKRAEKRKLERRLEKLIAIHFPSPSGKTEDIATTRGKRPGAAVGMSENRRNSSLLEFDLRNMTIQDAGGLWRGLFGSDDATTVRAAEQRITPWQDDAEVNKCPLCSTSFHPLTNRKHHCRICGKIICSLSPKLPQRPATCSLLFVVDPETRKIEEVGEGVDYGVRKRRVEGNNVAMSKKVGDHPEDDKFLKGIRICRTCRPVLLRQLYQHEVAHVPTFVKLYEALISLEYEIEEYVPRFQELILSLSHNNQPTKEASAMRKRLMEAFAQYDVLAKRIRKLPCPNGPGSSQDRVQVAIMTRANLFLQTNMVPLQSLSTPARATTAPENSSTNGNASNIGFGDTDSKVALALQPLLEQEALLESFVEEAQAQRKFEDVKTLKGNLGEIRAEIEKIFANAQYVNK